MLILDITDYAWPEEMLLYHSMDMGHIALMDDFSSFLAHL